MRQGDGEDPIVWPQAGLCVQSVVDDDGAAHPQAGVRWRGQNQPLWGALGGPPQGDLLAGLPAGMPQLGARQQPSGPPGDVETRRSVSAHEDSMRSHED